MAQAHPLLLLITRVDGFSEWVFDATMLENFVAGLPAGIGLRKSAELLKAAHPGYEFSTRDLREAIAATRLPADPAMAFCIRETASAGLGAYATRVIGRGERILAEAPLVELTIGKGESVNLTALIDQLNPTDRQSFLALSQSPMYGEQKRAVGIWKSNAYPQGSPLEAAADLHYGVERGSRKSAVYALACRFNHACTPNSHVAWNPRLRQQTIHALRDIRDGEELTVNYLAELSMPTAHRQQRLRDGFGFECTCATCILAATAREASDQRRSRIATLAGMVYPCCLPGWGSNVPALAPPSVGHGLPLLAWSCSCSPGTCSPLAAPPAVGHAAAARIAAAQLPPAQPSRQGRRGAHVGAHDGAHERLPIRSACMRIPRPSHWLAASASCPMPTITTQRHSTTRADTASGRRTIGCDLVRPVLQLARPLMRRSRMASTASSKLALRPTRRRSRNRACSGWWRSVWHCSRRRVSTRTHGTRSTLHAPTVACVATGRARDDGPSEPQKMRASRSAPIRSNTKSTLPPTSRMRAAADEPLATSAADDDACGLAGVPHSTGVSASVSGVRSGHRLNSGPSSVEMPISRMTFSYAGVPRPGPGIDACGLLHVGAMADADF